GEHWDVHLLHTPFVSKYREAVLSVPWVRHRDGQCGEAPLANVSNLWLNKLLPVVGGWFWGFPKRWNSIASGELTYDVRTLIGKAPLISAQVTAPGAKRPPSAFPLFAPVREIFDQTFLQRFLVYGPTCLCTLDFELDRGTLQPLTATIECSAKALPIGALHLKVESIETTSLGA